MNTKTNNKLTNKQLSRLTGLTTAYLYKLSRQGHLPRPDNGKWPIETLNALFTFYQEREEKENMLRNERLAKLVAERKLTQHRVEEKKKELINPDEITDLKHVLISRFKPVLDRSKLLPREKERIISELNRLDGKEETP